MRPQRWIRAACVLALAATHLPEAAGAQDAFADGAEDFVEGTNGGFNSELLPDIVLGPPRGTGLIDGSVDVLALGVGGSIVLRFDAPHICDGPGVDFTIFENAFHNGSPSGPIFDELAYVAVSDDGETFVELPFDTDTKVGFAGRGPVFSNPENGISPTDPAVSGGDSFDLAAVGLSRIRYVRITDVAGAIPDVGDLPPFLPAPKAGFDLDAAAAVNDCDGRITPTPTHTEIAASSPTATPLESSATATPSPDATAEPTSTSSLPTPTSTSSEPTPSTPDPGLRGDVDDNGVVDDRDIAAVIRDIFDGDAAADPRSDVNGDLHVSAADVADVSARRSE